MFAAVCKLLLERAPIAGALLSFWGPAGAWGEEKTHGLSCPGQENQDETKTRLSMAYAPRT